MDLQTLRTIHVHDDAAPFVSMTPGLHYRLVHARRGEFSVSELKAEPGSSSGLHRHLAGVFAFTRQGRWGHDHTYEYRPGTYVYETPGVVHRFLNGPAETRAFFVATGDLENIDAETNEVKSVLALDSRIERYLEACEQAGFARPNIVQ